MPACRCTARLLVDVPQGDWQFVIGVNIWGIIHGIRHFVPAILKHGEEGHIVNTASVAGFQNRRGTNQGPYSMSKYAALSLSEALEHELDGTNVGVSVLCPGPINTNIARGARNRPDHMGGPQIRASDEAVLAERLATTGLDPKKVGERVVDAIRTKTFYAFVGAVPADVIKGPPPPHRGGAEQPLGHALLRGACQRHDRRQARAEPAGLDGGARQPLSLQRRHRGAHLQDDPAGPAGDHRAVAAADDDRPEVGREVHLPAVLRRDRQGSYIVVASKGGAPQHPGWYRNILANPEVEVQVGTAKMKARARTATGEERARLWQEALEFWPPYADYQKKTEREIPVVVLDPVR